MCSYHSIPECCVMFSGVKLSMGLFVLFCIHNMINVGSVANNVMQFEHHVNLLIDSH